MRNLFSEVGLKMRAWGVRFLGFKSRGFLFLVVVVSLLLFGEVGAGSPPEFAPSGESVRADVFNRVVMDIYRQLGRGEKVVIQVSGSESEIDEIIDELQSQIDVLYGRQAQIESGQWFGSSNQVGVVSRAGNVMIGEIGSTSDKFRLVGDMSIKGGSLRIGDNATNRPLSLARIAPQIAIANSAGKHVWYISVPESSDISQSFNINRAGVAGTQFKIDPRLSVGRTYISQPVVFSKSGFDSWGRYITDDAVNYRIYISTSVHIEGDILADTVEADTVEADSITGETITGETITGESINADEITADEITALFYYGDISNTVGLNEDITVKFFEVATSTAELKSSLVALSTTTEQGFLDVAIDTTTIGGALSSHTGDNSIHFTMGEISISSSQVSGIDTLASALSSHTGNSDIHFEMSDIVISSSQVSGLGVFDDSHLAKLDDDNTFTGENIFNSPIIHGAGLHSIGGDPRGTGAVDLQTDRNQGTQVASGSKSVIGGGSENTASGDGSTISGGEDNIASGQYSSINGGQSNSALFDYSTIGGGSENTSGPFSVVAGGVSNYALGETSFIGGGVENRIWRIEGHGAQPANAVIGGGYGNVAEGDNSSILGGFYNEASGHWSTVGGGRRLKSTAQGSYTIGDSQNTYFTNDVEDGFYARFQGGLRFGNGTTDFLHLTEDGDAVFSGPVLHNGIQSTGGDERGLYAVDLQTHRTDNSQVASGDYSTIGGGSRNSIDGKFNTVSGGENNQATTADRASVGGGGNNIASGDGATVAGGIGNTASGYRAFVGSGQWNTASGEYAVVCGGYRNTASASQSAILGGSNVGAKATGASAMGDGQGDGFINNTPNSLAVRFDNGVRFAKTATTDLMTIDKEGAVQAKSSMVANSFKQEPIALNIENALEKSRNMSAVDNGIGMRKMDYSSIPVEVISQQTVIKRSVRDKKTGIVYDDIKDLPNIEVKSGGETISEKVEYDLIEEEYTYPIVDIAGLIELNRLAILELEDRVEELENHIKIIHEVFNQMIVEAGGKEIDFDILVKDMKQSGGNITAGVVSAVAIILAVIGLFKGTDDDNEGGLGVGRG